MRFQRQENGRKVIKHNSKHNFQQISNFLPIVLYKKYDKIGKKLEFAEKVMGRPVSRQRIEARTVHDQLLLQVYNYCCN